MRERDPLLVYNKHLIRTAYDGQVWHFNYCTDNYAGMDCPVATTKWRGTEDQILIWCPVIEMVVNSQHPLCEENDFNKLVLEEII